MNPTGLTWADIRFFKPAEFASPDKRDSGYMMNLDFVRKLDKLRESIKRPVVITSGYRTPEHNVKVGGVAGSAHTTGRAADLQALSGVHRYAILEAALRLGFRRIGIGTNFVHLDDDITKPQDVCWMYSDGD